MQCVVNSWETSALLVRLSVQRCDLCVISNRDCKQYRVWKRSGPKQLLIVVAMVTTRNIISSRVRTSLMTWVSVLLLWRLLRSSLKEQRRCRHFSLSSRSDATRPQTCVVSHPSCTAPPSLPVTLSYLVSSS